MLTHPDGTVGFLVPLPKPKREEDQPGESRDRTEEDHPELMGESPAAQRKIPEHRATEPCPRSDSEQASVLVSPRGNLA
jgi:hypothetical protein